MPGDSGYTEFLFAFNDADRASAAADVLRNLGYAAAVSPGDGEGRHFQLRLLWANALTSADHDRLVAESLRPLLARFRGRYEASETAESA
jgi:hypothetical protein